MQGIRYLSRILMAFNFQFSAEMGEAPSTSGMITIVKANSVWKASILSIPIIIYTTAFQIHLPYSLRSVGLNVLVDYPVLEFDSFLTRLNLKNMAVLPTFEICTYFTEGVTKREIFHVYH